MNGIPVDPPTLTFSVRVYQTLLIAYPTEFRREYGPHMLQVFQDCCRQAFHQNGTNGMIRLWGFTLLDFIRSVFEQHTQKETNMSRSQLIKFSGWAFILSSFVFVIYLINVSDPVAFTSTIVSSILLAAGLLGLRARYAEKVGGFGKSILLAGVIGMVFSYLVLAVLALMAYGILPAIRVQTSFGQKAWILLFIGPAILLLALAGFGLAALHDKPLVRLNWLPVIAGVWYPAFYLFLAVYLFTGDGVFPVQFNPEIAVIVSLQAITLCALGLTLITDKPSERVAI